MLVWTSLEHFFVSVDWAVARFYLQGEDDWANHGEVWCLRSQWVSVAQYISICWFIVCLNLCEEVVHGEWAESHSSEEVNGLSAVQVPLRAGRGQSGTLQCVLLRSQNAYLPGPDLGKGTPDFKTGPVFVNIQSHYGFFFFWSAEGLHWFFMVLLWCLLQVDWPGFLCRVWLESYNLQVRVNVDPTCGGLTSGLWHEHDWEPLSFNQLFLLIVLELGAVSLCSKCAWSHQEPGVRPFCHLAEFSCLWIWSSLKWMLPKNFQGK